MGGLRRNRQLASRSVGSSLLYRARTTWSQPRPPLRCRNELAEIAEHLPGDRHAGPCRLGRENVITFSDLLFLCHSVRRHRSFAGFSAKNKLPARKSHHIRRKEKGVSCLDISFTAGADLL